MTDEDRDEARASAALDRVVSAGPIRSRPCCDGGEGLHGPEGRYVAHAKIVIVFDVPLLWGAGAPHPRDRLYACDESCVARLAHYAEERGAKVVRTEALS